MRERNKEHGVKLCPNVDLKDIDFIEPPPNSKRLEETLVAKEENEE